MGWLSIHNEICEKNSNTGQEICAAYNSFLFILLQGFEIVQESSETIIAFGTLALAFFTFTLWRATNSMLVSAREDGARMERSIDEASRAAIAMQSVAKSMEINAAEIVRSVKHQETFGQAQLRAYISVLIGGARYQDDTIRFEASPIIINTGHSPAKNLRYRISADILPVPLPADFKFPLPKDSRGSNLLGPQQTSQMIAVVAERIAEEDVERTKAAIGCSLYVWGRIRYEDIFGITRRCTFCQQIYWVALGPMIEDGTIPMNIRGWYLGKHNHAS